MVVSVDLSGIVNDAVVVLNDDVELLINLDVVELNKINVVYVLEDVV